MSALQRTPEWYQARLGKLTASRMADAIAKARTGGGWGVSRANLMAVLIAERLTREPYEGYQSPAMERGTASEDQAVAAYAFRHDVDVTECGFIDHPKIAMSGASPDGLIGDVGLIEVKCPNTATHLETLGGGTVPGKYLTQIQWQLAVTGRAWCDLLSFDNRLPEAMRLHVQRIERDAGRIAELETEARAFLAELDAKVSALEARYGRREAA